MKLEKIQAKSMAPTLKWGLLPAVSSTYDSCLNVPSLTSQDYQVAPLLTRAFTKRPIKLSYNLLINSSLANYSDELPTIFDKYTIFRYSSFIEFFSRNRVDVPKCFKPSHSLRRLNFELFFFRLATYLMKKGKKEKIFIALNRAFQLFFLGYKKLPIYNQNLDYTNWVHFYYVINNITVTGSQYKNFSFNMYGNTLNQHFIKKGLKYHSSSSNLFSIINKLLSVVQILFTFSLFSLDKRARKAGRKKSSKYVFIWRYVPLYKRKAVLLKLIAKDIKFSGGKTFVDRLTAALDLLQTSPQKSHVVQTNHFAHQYVFRNLRRTLLSNLKMTA